MQYTYDFTQLDKIPDGPTSAQVAAKKVLSGPTLQTGKSSTIAAVLTGERLIVALAGQERGSGAKAHTHPNEQFNYILSGTMTGEIAGQTVFSPPGTILHTPATAVHTGQAAPDENLIFFAMKDKRGGIVGPPVDGRYDGPNYLPGFGRRADEARKTTAQMVQEAGWDIDRQAVRYIYDTRDGALPEHPASSVPVSSLDAVLGEGARGLLLHGDLMRVGVVHLPEGWRGAAARHQAEQFVLVVDGTLHARVDGADMVVESRCVLHLPAGVERELSAAPGGGLTLCVLQDDRQAFAV